MDKFLKKKPVEDQVASGSRNILKKSRAPVIFWLIFLRSRVYVLRFLNMTQLIKIKEYCISIDLFANKISTDFACCNSNCGENLFSNEDCQKSIAQSFVWEING